jgi:hypothetical protein
VSFVLIVTISWAAVWWQIHSSALRVITLAVRCSDNTEPSIQCLRNSIMYDHFFVCYNRCVGGEKRVWLLLIWITMWIPEIISHFLCNGLMELSPTVSCEYYFLLYAFKCFLNIYFCYMINLHYSGTIFIRIYLLEYFATFNMGVCLCVYMCMYGCWCGSLCICTTIM